MLRTLIICILVMIVWTTAAAAEVTVTYLGGLDSYPTIDHTTTADCIVGNTGQPGSLHTDETGYGGLGMATTFDPLAFDCPCGVGFTVEAIHMVVAKLDSGAIEIWLNLALGDAFLREDYPPSAECFVPTPCPAGSYNYNRYCYAEALASFDEAGFYEVTFTGDLEYCGCIYTTYTHTIVTWLFFYFYDGFRLVTDENPAHCPDHYAYIYYLGACQWAEIDAPGNLLFWAEASCCEPPTTTDHVTWGRIKSLYH